MLAIVIIIALIFTLTNGLHDASSVVATMIACKAASPVQAILIASIFGLLGVFFSGNQVADTVSAIIKVSPSINLIHILIASLLGAVVWNIVTWRIGIPSSSTHALVGGLIGAAWIANGPDSILWGVSELFSGNHQVVGIMKVIVSLIFSPVLGFSIAYVIQKISMLLLRNAKFSINRTINKLQWIVAAALAFSHGANDSQKITGLISLALISAGVVNSHAVPPLIKIAIGLIMFLGTALGGWKIMKTIGNKIYDLRPIHSLNSMISSGTSILFATFTGAPVSTTHVVVGGIMGVGSADEYRMVNWNIGKEIVTAWFITIPCSAIASSIIYFLINGVIF
ncbi:inorganic phosphate transporter [Rummeliibacillus suwonensis]|uniref:inorganic phosphate transporter n=1 Tax=Rummeliibacillus suwonensis TaxID=1306154 RepID=UPI001AAF9802|nr:inorganic phosphate transporter [Rummeliibacillus suwonensis]MBO2537049.1 inorganic phosphate transporter [Rummeliibacillus suwonensis]